MSGGAPGGGLFTPLRRAGSGPPLVLLHGFSATWRVWELVLPALERRHDVLALTLPGHAGGPALEEEVGVGSLADGVELSLDRAGIGMADLVGNSLGGHVALQLAARGRARTVVALAPAGGWLPGDDSYRSMLASFREMLDQLRAAAPHADAILATRAGRRQATRFLVERFEHIPVELIAHGMLGMASCPAATRLLDAAEREPWTLAAEAVTCPVWIVWGTSDRLLPWPSAAARYRRGLHADWVVLDGVGHCPQLELPLETAELISGWTA